MKTLFFTILFIPLSLWSNQSLRPQRVLIVSPEQTDILQTGGLAHATTGLARALNRSGIRTDVLMPHYLEMNAPENLQDTGARYQVELDWQNGIPMKTESFSVLSGRSKGFTTQFLKHNSKQGFQNYFDNRSVGGSKKSYGPEAIIGEAYGAFAKASAQMILDGGYDVVILNDWTTGLIATEIQSYKDKGRTVPKVVFAIHNLAYQGLFPKSLVEFLGMDEAHFTTSGYEYFGQVSFIKAGIQYADHIYTVSPRYASEITTPSFGMGLDGLMREKEQQGKLTGILNGIDEAEWDPSNPQHPDVRFAFSPTDLSGKAKGKAELQSTFGLPVDSNVPVFVLTSRLAEQKGFEYLLGALGEVAQQRDVQILIVGDGETQYIKKAQDLQLKHPDKVRYTGFSSSLEKRATAYGDFFINGAWFEPSGLNQFFAFKNGTIPIVSQVGGLASSVTEGVSGFVFPIIAGQNGQPYDSGATIDSVVEAVLRAELSYKTEQEKIIQMRLSGMEQSNSWDERVVQSFLPFFKKVLSNPDVEGNASETGIQTSQPSVSNRPCALNQPQCASVLAN